MKDIVEIGAYMDQKLHYFMEFEALGLKILSAPADEIEGCLEQRETLEKKIDYLDRKLTELCQGDEALWLTVRGRRGLDEVPPELRELHQLAQRVLATVNRSLQLQDQIASRLELEKDVLLQYIKKSNQSNTAQAARFYGATSTEGSRPIVGPGRKI